MQYVFGTAGSYNNNTIILEIIKQKNNSNNYSKLEIK